MAFVCVCVCVMQIWLWEVLWSFFSVQPTAGHCPLSYKIHFLLHITIWLRNSMLLCRIREDDTSKRFFFFFWFAVSSWGTHLSSFFTFPIFFKCQMTTEWSTLSSWAAFHVVVRGSALMIALNWLLSTSDGQSLCSSSPKLSSPLQNFLNQHCTVRFLEVPGPNGLVLWVVSTTYNPFWTWIKWIAQICFLSNIISTV